MIRGSSSGNPFPLGVISLRSDRPPAALRGSLRFDPLQVRPAESLLPAIVDSSQPRLVIRLVDTHFATLHVVAKDDVADADCAPEPNRLPRLFRVLGEFSEREVGSRHLSFLVTPKILISIVKNRLSEKSDGVVRFRTGLYSPRKSLGQRFRVRRQQSDSDSPFRIVSCADSGHFCHTIPTSSPSSITVPRRRREVARCPSQTLAG